MSVLGGLKILVPESRELDLFARMLETEGAAVLRCPLVQIKDVEDTAEAETWIESVVAGSCNDIIWLTGEGLRRPDAHCHPDEPADEFVAALARVRNITRGPKPASALRELGLAPGLAAIKPTRKASSIRWLPKIIQSHHRRADVSRSRCDALAGAVARPGRKGLAGHAVSLCL